MYVDFISDEYYKECVRYVLDSFNKAYDLRDSIKKAVEKGDIFESELFSNVVDPFKMQFEVEKIGIREWIQKEVLRQLDKSVEQKMGEFHQRILGGVAGWEDLKTGKGVDLKSEDDRIHLELKNKYNTTNSSALKNVRGTLERITSSDHTAKAYWAYIIANSKEKSGEGVWVMSGFNKIDSVRKVWGENVYELVTGKKSALNDIYKTLPKVISEVSKETDIADVKKVIDEILVLLEPYLEDIRLKIYSKVFIS